MKFLEGFSVLLSIFGVISGHVEEDARNDTICTYFMDDNQRYAAKCDGLGLEDENEHVRFTGQQLEGKTNEDVRLLEIVPPSSSSFVPSQDIFTYFVNLENLVMNNVNIQRLEYIYNCYPLFYISLSGNSIKEVPHDAFFICRDLTILDLSKNEIRKIHENSFGGAKNLMELNLSYNFIEELPRKLLKPVKQLRKLDIKNNRLKSVPYNALNDLFELTFLDMTNNLLTTLDVRFFDFVMNLETLSLAGNRINKFLPGTFKSLKRLVNLDLSGNSLTSLSAELLSKNVNLMELKINGCNIKEIELFFFDSMPHLSLVEARNNKCIDGSFEGTWRDMLESFSPCLKQPRARGGHHAAEGRNEEL